MRNKILRYGTLLCCALLLLAGAGCRTNKHVTATEAGTHSRVETLKTTVKADTAKTSFATLFSDSARTAAATWDSINFVLNYDSYTGNMLHNYYLYEKDGKLSMLPWDYNLAFGGFGGGGGRPDGNQGEDNKDSSSGATSLINTGIDTPLSGSNNSERPMWSWIASNEEYLEKYHEVYDELLKNYFENGDFEKEIERVYNMIRPYVEKDPSAFYTVDEFDKAYETLKSFCLLRAESIRKQLDGSLSASTDKQNSADKVDASNINTADMGSHSGGKDGNSMNPMNFGGNFRPGGNNNNTEEATTEN